MAAPAVRRQPVWSGPLTRPLAARIPLHYRPEVLAIIKFIHTAVFFSVAAVSLLAAAGYPRWDRSRIQQTRLWAAGSTRRRAALDRAAHRRPGRGRGHAGREDPGGGRGGGGDVLHDRVVEEADVGCVVERHPAAFVSRDVVHDHVIGDIVREVAGLQEAQAGLGAVQDLDHGLVDEEEDARARRNPRQPRNVQEPGKPVRWCAAAPVLCVTSIYPGSGAFRPSGSLHE